MSDFPGFEAGVASILSKGSLEAEFFGPGGIVWHCAAFGLRATINIRKRVGSLSAV
jgi:hypothetical protein